MNPSGLCLCGCGLPTTLARQSDTKRGWVKGQPTDYVHGHGAALRAKLTRKLGPYKAGRTVMAQKAVGKIEAAIIKGRR